VSVKVDKVKETTDSGIVLAQADQKQETRGVIQSVGNDVKTLEPEDYVIFNNYVGNKVLKDNEELLLIKEGDILAKIIGGKK
jgi:co-chaperonin GroES (HSP10)